MSDKTKTFQIGGIDLTGYMGPPAAGKEHHGGLIRYVTELCIISNASGVQIRGRWKKLAKPKKLH